MSSGSASSSSTMGRPEVFGVFAPSLATSARRLAVRRWILVRSASPRRSLIPSPRSEEASEATGGGPENVYGGAVISSRRRMLLGQATKASSEEYALES